MDAANKASILTDTLSFLSSSTSQLLLISQLIRVKLPRFVYSFSSTVRTWCQWAIRYVLFHSYLYLLLISLLPPQWMTDIEEALAALSQCKMPVILVNDSENVPRCKVVWNKIILAWMLALGIGCWMFCSFLIDTILLSQSCWDKIGITC